MFDPRPDYITDEATDVGLKRDLNEDSMLSRPNLGVWMVADGMGGHSGGDFASQAIISQVAALDAHLTGPDIMRAVRETLIDANTLIQAESAKRGGKTMGSTAVSLILSDEHFACLWVGDSRLYHCRDGGVSQLSSDHSLVNEWVEQGRLTPEEAEVHPHANVITRAVGVAEEVEVDKIRGRHEPGDRFLLCSDGLTGYMDLDVLKNMLANDPVKGLARRLVEEALKGGGGDNVTVIVVEVPF